jgi:hypothetical protein
MSAVVVALSGIVGSLAIGALARHRTASASYATSD